MAGRRTEVPEFPAAPRFLIVETGFVGDVLVVTPALRALREAYPDAEMTGLVRPNSGMVLIGMPNMTRLLPLPGKHRRGFFSVMGLSSWVRGQRFDAAFVFRPSFRSALIPFLGGVPVRAGLSSEGRGFLLTHKAPYEPRMSEVRKHLTVVGLVGVEPRGTELEMFLTEKERAEAARLLEDAPGGPLVAIHPGANWPIRRWFPERFAELGARLRDETGVSVVYLAGPADEKIISTIRAWYREAGREAPMVIEPPNVRVLAAVIEASDVAVTNNSGPLHITSSVGTDGVFIHGPTPVERWHLPDSRHTDIFAQDLACRPCDSTECQHERFLCLDAISVDRVHDAVVERLPGSESS
jgi:heptosyltransferase-2